MLIDIGANLTHESFVHDLDEVLLRAARSGVTRFIATGTTVAGSEAAPVSYTHLTLPTNREV